MSNCCKCYSYTEPERRLLCNSILLAAGLHDLMTLVLSGDAEYRAQLQIFISVDIQKGTQ